MATSSLAAPLVWINGFPGVGKLTIAKKLVELMSSKDAAILIDNHQLIDPVAALYDRDHVEYYSARRAEREKAFARWVTNAAEAKRTVVFTDCQVQNELGQSVVEEYQKVAAESMRPFVPICLTCDHAVNLNRVCSDERVTSGTTKLVDVHALQQILAEHIMLVLHHPNEMHLDVTTLSPGDAAQRLLGYVKRFECRDG